MEITTVKNLHFKWTISRGRETYGYNICTLFVDGDKVSSCNGGGYDMQGTVFGEWLQNAYNSKIKDLALASTLNAERTYTRNGETITVSSVKEFYGLTYSMYVDNFTKHSWSTVTLDGACGFDSMKRIAEAIGITINWNKESDKYKNHSFYTAFVK